MAGLNKNQTKFFEEAIKHFGDKSSDVRYKDLTDFADKNDLIVPVSALKLFCQGDVRGHYNLTLSGVSSNITSKNSPGPVNILDESDTGSREGIIISSSIFADSTPHSSRVIEPVSPKTLYLVIDDDLLPQSVHKSINGAYDKCIRFLNSKNTTTLEQAQKDIRSNKCHCVMDRDSAHQCYIHEILLEG